MHELIAAAAVLVLLVAYSQIYIFIAAWEVSLKSPSKSCGHAARPPPSFYLFFFFTPPTSHGAARGFFMRHLYPRGIYCTPGFLGTRDGPPREVAGGFEPAFGLPGILNHSQCYAKLEDFKRFCESFIHGWVLEALMSLLFLPRCVTSGYGKVRVG